jgi:ABC-type histidine transport system ATPase subunit
MEHADLDATIDRLAETVPTDELLLRRLKKRRLALRDRSNVWSAPSIRRNLREDPVNLLPTDKAGAVPGPERCA